MAASSATVKELFEECYSEAHTALTTAQNRHQQIDKANLAAAGIVVPSTKIGTSSSPSLSTVSLHDTHADHIKEYADAKEKVFIALKQARADLEKATEKTALIAAKYNLQRAKMLAQHSENLTIHFLANADKHIESAEDKLFADAKNPMFKDEEKLAFFDMKVAEEIEEIEEKTKKANRLWYNIFSWSPEERKARFATLLFAIVCGIASYNGLQEQTSVAAMATLAGSVIGMLVTIGVNMNGFWDNVVTLLKTKKQEKPKGFTYGFYLIALMLFSVGGLINAAQQLQPTIEQLEGEDVILANVAIAILGLATAFAMTGLFTQQPRKWFTAFSKTGFMLTLKNGFRELWYALDHDELVKLEAEGKTPSGPATTLRGVSNVVFFLFFAFLTIVAAVAGMQYAGESMLGLFHVPENNAHVMRAIEAASWLFVISRGIYNATISVKLGIMATKFIETCGTVSSEYLQAAYKKLNTELGWNPVVSAIIPVIFSPLALLYAAWEGEKACFREAKEYAHVQYAEKGAWFFWPHFIFRVLYNNMHIWGVWNAYNNGAQNKHAAGSNDSEELTLREKAAGPTATAGSLGFYFLAAKPRQDGWRATENYRTTEMKTRSLPVSYTYFWTDDLSGAKKATPPSTPVTLK